MVPDYDDDDIVEDYEEVSTDSPVRRVNSAQGGPVQRPSGGVRPSTTAMPALDEDGEFGPPTKGKITKKSAKLIWIICIGVSVLGVAAVLVDMLIDPLGRHNKGVANTTNIGEGGDNSRIPPRKRTEEKSQHEKNADAFTTAAYAHYKKAVGTRSYDFLRLAMNEMNKKFDIANEERSDKALWAEAWVAYYNAEYAVELYYHANNVDLNDTKFKPVPDFRDREQTEFLEDSDLLDPEAQRIQGIVQAVSNETTKIGKHNKLLKAFVVSANVLEDEDEAIRGPIDEAKAKLEAARNEKQFDQEDLEYVNRAPRGPDEPPPYID